MGNNQEEAAISLMMQEKVALQQDCAGFTGCWNMFIEENPANKEDRNEKKMYVGVTFFFKILLTLASYAL